MKTEEFSEKGVGVGGGGPLESISIMKVCKKKGA